MLNERFRSAAESLHRLHAEPPPIESLVAARRRRRIAGVTALAAVALAVALPLTLLPGSDSTSVKVYSPPEPTSTGRTGPTTAPNATVPSTPSTTSTSVPPQSPTTFASGSIVAALPLVVCPTTFAIAEPPPAQALPATVQVTVPGGTADQLAVYSDNQGRMKLLAPRGWVCTALYGADGSGGVEVAPRGESVPSSWGAGWALPASSADEAIMGSETSACALCTLGQACPLFTSAATTYRNQFGHECPKTRPPSETVAPISSGIVGFTDPPGVSGDGVPSGGVDPANGVMTYVGGSSSGSYLDTCTLPTADRHLCTAALDTFAAWYGQM